MIESEYLRRNMAHVVGDRDYPSDEITVAKSYDLLAELDEESKANLTSLLFQNVSFLLYFLFRGT